jgi:hypothetical protein
MSTNFAEAQNITKDKQATMVAEAIRLACERGESYVSVPRLCGSLVTALKEQGFGVTDMVDSKGFTTYVYMITW